MSQPSTQQRILGRVNSLLIPAAMNLMHVRLAHYDPCSDPARPEYNEHVIFVFWHENIPVVLPHYGHTPITILVSQHRDGEWVNQVAENLRIHVVRGSSTRGGSQAIRQLKRNSKFSSIVISPDGPRGPKREMAAGPIFIAAMLGMPIVPVAVGIDRPWRLNTWDKMAFPKPFSRVRMIFGPKVYIPRKCSREQMEERRVSVQNLLNQLTHTAEDWAESGQKMVGEKSFYRASRRNKIVFPDRPDASKLQVIHGHKKYAA